MPTETDHIALALELTTARTRDSLVAAMQRVADGVGAAAFNLAYFDTGAHSHAYFAAHNMPDGVIHQYKDPASAKADPVTQHLRQHSTPVAWGRVDYRAPELRQRWELCADHGMRSGTDVALHLAPTRHFVLGLCWAEASLPPAEVAARMRLVQTLAVFAEPSAQIIATLEAEPEVDCALSPRELVCLWWVSRGLTDAMIAPMLGLGTRTVEKHVFSANQKLKAANRAQAVLRAQALGLLERPPVRAFD